MEEAVLFTVFIHFSLIYSYSKSFTGQACSVKIVRYWHRSFFAQKKKELDQYPAIAFFDRKILANIPYMYGTIKFPGKSATINMRSSLDTKSLLRGAGRSTSCRIFNDFEDGDKNRLCGGLVG